MPNRTFMVTVVDLWPKLKLVVTRDGGARDEGPVMYDIANSKFHPIVENELRLAVEAVIKQRRQH
jgi:hypothetical protein